ncbi:MAG: tape measure protein, partial [Rhodoferax sp.]|nr:tape measure protein [Rhodoferax sp.]
ETLSKAIRVSGANAVEAKTAMVQFGQAMGSGKLQGDELRSMMESAPYLMRKLAEGIGVPVGALKKLGEEGKLTSDVVANALSKAAESIDADFQKFPQTIAAAMDVALDAASRANAQIDELAGTSTTLTGVVKGTGEALDELARQLSMVGGKSGELSKNAIIKQWADESRIAMSYMIDAADVVWQTISTLGRNVAYVLKSTGAEIGGIGAQIGAVMRGDFAGAKAIGDAMEADSEARRAALDEADKKTLGRAQTMGTAMRAAWDQKKIEDRGFTPSLNKGKITAPAGASDGKKKGAAFDSAKYLADLKRQTVDGWEAIAVVEAEAVRKAGELLKSKKISAQEHEEAMRSIAKGAAKDRQDLMASETEKSLAELSDRYAKEQAIKDRAIQYGAALTMAVNPVDALRQEYEAKLALVTQYEQLMAQAGVDATAQGQATRAQIESTYQLQRTALAEQTFRSQGEAQAFLIDSLNALSSSATSSIMGLLNGTLTAQDAMKGLANVVLNEAVSALVQIGIQQIKNALLGDTLAAADAARKVANGAVYTATVAAQVTGMSAMAAMNAFAATAAIPVVGPGLAPAAAASAAAIAGALGAPAIATAPLAGARQYGGPANSGNLYRVNEKGAPEMFTAANGSQYMMPTQSGRVTAADRMSSGAITIINNGRNPIGQVTQETKPNGDRSIYIHDAIAAVNAAMSDPNSSTSRAMGRNFRLPRSR